MSTSSDGLACDAVVDSHQDPLESVASDLGVETLWKEDLVGVLDDDEANAPAGVRLSFAAPPGWTEPWLERRVGCYRRGHAATDVSPLAVDYSEVRVSTRTGRFVIDVVGRDDATVRKIQDSARVWSQHGAAQLVSRR